jgi:hypothetical protein
MRLTSQQVMVRIVLQDAIENVHLHLVFRHAFPTAPDLVNSTRLALVDAARECSPRTAVIHERLLVDEEYLEDMSFIVSITFVAMTFLIFLIAACLDPNYPEGYQGALQQYGHG